MPDQLLVTIATLATSLIILWAICMIFIGFGIMGLHDDDSVLDLYEFRVSTEPAISLDIIIVII